VLQKQPLQNQTVVKQTEGTLSQHLASVRTLLFLAPTFEFDWNNSLYVLMQNLTFYPKFSEFIHIAKKVTLYYLIAISLSFLPFLKIDWKGLHLGSILDFIKFQIKLPHIPMRIEKKNAFTVVVWKLNVIKFGPICWNKEYFIQKNSFLAIKTEGKQLIHHPLAF